MYFFAFIVNVCGVRLVGGKIVLPPSDFFYKRAKSKGNIIDRKKCDMCIGDIGDRGREYGGI